MKKLLLLMTLSLAAGVNGQITNAPRTYFEAFNATPDALLIKGSSTIDTLNNQINYPVEVRAERVSNPQTTNSIYAGLVAHHLSPARPGRLRGLR